VIGLRNKRNVERNIVPADIPWLDRERKIQERENLTVAKSCRIVRDRQRQVKALFAREVPLFVIVLTDHRTASVLTVVDCVSCLTGGHHPR
jgi:hypothetical protein